MDYNFVEVMEHFDRLCKEYSYHCNEHECPIIKLINDWEIENEEDWEKSCVYYGYKYPYEFAEEVMKWAETHPIPDYGTIKDMLKEMFKMMNISGEFYHPVFDTKINKEVAERFNIKPINYPESDQ